MDVQHMLETPEDEGRMWRTLDTLGRLIDLLERRALPAEDARRTTGKE
jgi:hypothetical protein